ncbi:protein of unknown function [Chitinophaga sp. CF118]|uniref:DUF4302 domain-containing protein n=1 Tax=Chitinophaga sp. CF118 TaxID=1884367 RepID=UPI0008ED0C03|nr:DUF4302 domain-containing protein [Chitinophaga sp. CF118]SFE06478.1 protein of unknown function [Chitinophaga sp. CF118]
MSKNLLLYILLITATFSSCTRKDDFVFDQSPDERINKILAEYSSALTGSEYGWRGFVYPSGIPGTPFGFYFKFDTANRVQMFSDFDSLSAVTVKESSYRLKALQQPSLLFDTYSYIHVLCDPDASNNGGTYGVGLYSDFEFAIDGIYGDTIKLTGRLHGSKAVLVKATSQEAQDYYEKKRNWEFNNISRFLTYFKQLTAGGSTYDMYVDKTFRRIQFVWPTTDGTKTFNTAYYHTSNGIALTTPFSDGKQNISAFENITWDAPGQALKFKVNNADATINGVIKPLVVDNTAGKRWWNYVADIGSYWVSLDGFHVDGVDDAYGIKNTPGFQFMFYYPNWNTNLDAGAVFTSSAFGPGLTARFNTNGTVVFTNTATIGTTPASATTAVTNITNKYTEPTGFYFVQTGELSYDMVNAKDARSWITWLR